jgi:D-cysteine desulfhydrase family pyridoxal phosphate-dependent enzyme
MLERRVELGFTPTPVRPLDRLAAELGRAPGSTWIKHDDATALGNGGNKLRKLEYLCAEALEQGCDVLVTGGGRQSNHARLTAASANRLGLDCHLVLAGDRPEVATGNVLLDELLGAPIEWVGGLDYYPLEDAIVAAADRLAREGRRPYAVPVGGASAVGTLGYARTALEILAQVPDVDVVVVADGSGGTHAGLVAGLGDHARVIGVDVGTRPDLLEAVPALAAEVAALAALPEPVGAVRLDVDRIGPGYGEPTPDCREALDLMARLEGVVLDPVYTGKAMAGLIAAVRGGEITSSQRIMFVHTGGTPALFASSYAAWVRDG